MTVKVTASVKVVTHRGYSEFLIVNEKELAIRADWEGEILRLDLGVFGN